MDIQLKCGNLHICPSKQDLTELLAKRILSLASEAVAQYGCFTVALSGGSTPKALYQQFALEPYRHQMPWSCTHVFWGDERCVSHTSPESNFAMASEALLSKVDIPASNIHSTVDQDVNPDKAAFAYEKIIRSTCKMTAGNIPRFNLILLGLGVDGHTASLFPGTRALEEKENLVVANYVEALKCKRITFTLPIINNAEHVIFIVAGAEKQAILSSVLESGALIYPAQLIKPIAGTLEWYVDKLSCKPTTCADNTSS